MPLDEAAKKKILRDFTYGLYAVTSAHDDERGVFTAVVRSGKQPQ